MKPDKQKEARRLRKQGLSLSEIVTKIGCAKSSVSRWTRDIPLTKTQVKNLRRKEDQGRLKGRIAAATHPNSPKQVWAKKRDEARQKGHEEISRIDDISLKILIAALYWGEGSKGRNSFSIANTDPAMVRLIAAFLRKHCQVPEERLRFRVYIHPHLSLRKARIYWAKIAGTSPKNIASTTAVSSASQGKKDSCPYGTFQITYCDTLFRSRIEGWMDALKEQIPG